MKLKIKSSRKFGHCLVGESKPEESLLYKQAEMVKTGNNETLLSFSYEPKGKGYEFRYYLEAARPINNYLKQPLTNEYFEGILLSFLRLAQTCEQQELSMKRILFQHEFVFFDSARFVLRFAYVPLKMKDQPTDPLEAIVHIMERASFANGATKSKADRVLDYARSCAIFDWVDYEKLLQELGVIERSKPTESMSEPKPALPDDDSRDSGGLPVEDWITEPLDSEGPNSFSKPNLPSGRLERSGEMKAITGSVVLANPESGESWILREGEYLLGSTENCQIMVKGKGVSRSHAKVTVRKDGCLAEDMDSTNGTFVNEQRLDPHHPVEIASGDILQLAKTVLRLDWEK